MVSNKLAATATTLGVDIQFLKQKRKHTLVFKVLGHTPALRVIVDL
jgi:hypothetical protein